MKSAGFLRLKNKVKAFVFLLIFYSHACCQAGSYDDFFTAIKQDNPAEIAALLNRGFDVNTVNPAGEHGLLLAVRESSLKVVAVLLNWPKTKIEVRTQQDESPLMLASLQGLTEVCQQLIDKGADVNKLGWTPLHYAATHGHLAVMRLLLDNHAYIDAESPNRTTPLMMAASYGTSSAVKLLLEEGADPSLKNDQGLSALDFAQRASRKDSAEIIAAFIRGRQPKGIW